MKYLTKCPKVVTWLTVALLTVTLLPSCSKPSTSRFLFHSPKEAIEACHSELTSLREIRTADIDRLTSVVNEWLVLQDSVYNCLASDTTIQLNTNLTTYYYIIVDSIRDEINRIARLQPHSLKDVTYLKIHTAKNREKTHSSKDFKNASELFGNMEGAGLYKDLNTTTEAYISLLETTAPFSKEDEFVDFLQKEDRCFRSLMAFLSEADQKELAIITSKTSQLFDDLYSRVSDGEKNTITERISLLLIMRFNRRIIQNAEACMSDIKARKRLTDQQRDNYRWMLIQPFMSIDGYSMASLTDGQEKSLLRLSDELPSLFAYLDNTPDSSKDLIKLSEVLSDFFLSSYMKSSL